MNDSEIPEGMVLIPKGGRPKKDTRNVAIMLARHWKINHFGELAKQADEWIIERWKKTPGISEGAHIRRAVSKGKDLAPNGFIISSGTIVTCFLMPVKNGSKGWIWWDGMTEAQEVEVQNLSLEVEAVLQKMNPTSVAARQFFTAQNNLLNNLS